MQFLTNVLLSPYIIFGVLALIFLVISYWSLVGLQEYAGYILGVLVGLLVVFVVSSLGVEPNVEGQAQELQNTTLNLFQATCPAILGIAVGIAFLIIPRLVGSLPTSYGQVIPRGLNVAVITALWVTLLFLFFLVGIETQRMIGIFALAFMIARLFAVVMAGGSNPNAILIRQPNGTITAQAVDPNSQPLYDPLTGDPMTVVQPPTPPGRAFRLLDAIRARMQQRNLPPGQ
jgi:hypothetical protein